MLPAPGPVLLPISPVQSRSLTSSGRHGDPPAPRFCGAPGWARRVTDGRPYSSLVDLLGVAAAAWTAREPGDLDSAMAGHLRIGERRLSGLAAQEHAGVGTDVATVTALADGNAAYEK